MCRRLDCSWAELQQMPEWTVEVWEAVIAGEEQGRRTRQQQR